MFQNFLYFTWLCNDYTHQKNPAKTHLRLNLKVTSNLYLIADKSVDETSDSSGVGTATSDLSNSISLPGTTVICLENYSSNLPGHLSIMQGDILEGECVRNILFLSTDVFGKTRFTIMFCFLSSDGRHRLRTFRRNIAW